MHIKFVSHITCAQLRLQLDALKIAVLQRILLSTLTKKMYM